MRKDNLVFFKIRYRKHNKKMLHHFISCLSDSISLYFYIKHQILFDRIVPIAVIQYLQANQKILQEYCHHFQLQGHLIPLKGGIFMQMK